MFRSRCELACGLLEREETPPSLQALELAIISWRQLAPGQKRYPAMGSDDGE